MPFSFAELPAMAIERGHHASELILPRVGQLILDGFAKIFKDTCEQAHAIDAYALEPPGVMPRRAYVLASHRDDLCACDH